MEHLLLSCIESRVEKNRSFYGRFQLGPFDLGQGLTVATALRRTLLSELTGLAITAVAIQGASHEYSTLCGVRESVLDILLNLKQIVFSVVDPEFENDSFPESDKGSQPSFVFESKENLINKQILPESQIGFLKVCGPGIVKARDIKLSPSIHCVDPDQYIATLASNGILEIRFIISNGKNYIIQTKAPSELSSPLFQQQFSNSSLNTDLSTLQKPQSNFLSKNLLKKTKSFIKDELPAKDQITNKPRRGTPLRGPVNSKTEAQNTNSLRFTKSENFITSNASDLENDSSFKLTAKTPLTGNVSGTSMNGQALNSNRVIQSGSPEQNSLRRTPKGFIPLLSETEKQIDPISVLAKNKFISKTSIGIPNLVSKLNSIKKSQIELLKIDKMTNILLIDAIFMPVNRVNFLLENDDESIEIKEKVILEIWTNGSIHPRKAIHQAASAIIKIFLPFQETNSPHSFILNSDLQNKRNSKEILRRQESYTNKKKVKFAAKKDNLAIKKNRASIDIGNLELSLRPYTCLKRANINTVNDLLQYSPDELLLLKNFGKRSLEEVETTLAQLGLKLGRHNSNELFGKKSN